MAWLKYVATADSGVAKVSTARSAIGEIAEALLELGGSAHRDTVIDRVAVRRGEPRVSEGLTAELLAAFEQHRARARLRKQPALLHLPFGEGSRRWSLTRGGAAALRRTQQHVATIGEASGRHEHEVALV
jgi:hypothetical protein